MGVHAIDTVRYLLGDPGPTRVQASIGTGYSDAAVDDDGIVLIDWEGGTRSTVEFGWWAPHLGGLEADTELFGATGYARLWPPGEQAPGYDHCSLPMYAAQMADFAARCTDRGHVPPTGAPTAGTGLVAQRILSEAYAVGGRG
jgi:predicted dehydrogenase